MFYCLFSLFSAHTALMRSEILHQNQLAKIFLYQSQKSYHFKMTLCKDEILTLMLYYTTLIFVLIPLSLLVSLQKKSLSNNFKRLLLNGSLIFKKNFHNVFPATQVIQGYAKACWARTLVSTSKSYWCMIKVQTIFKTGKNGRPDCIRLTDQQTHHN